MPFCFVNINEANLKIEYCKYMRSLSLSREVEGKRPDETRQPAKLLALQWCQLRQKAKYLSFLRDEDKTFAKESFASSFQKGL